MTRPYDDIIDFLVAGDPKAVAEFQPSTASRERFRYLLERQKDCALTPEESAEFDTCLNLEHLMRLAKVRAHQALDEMK